MRHLAVVVALAVAACGSPVLTAAPGGPAADPASGPGTSASTAAAGGAPIRPAASPAVTAAPHLCAPPALRRPRGT